MTACTVSVANSHGLVWKLLCDIHIYVHSFIQVELVGGGGGGGRRNGRTSLKCMLD